MKLIHIISLNIAMFFIPFGLIADEVLFDNVSQGPGELGGFILSDYDIYETGGDLYQNFMASDFSITKRSHLTGIRWTGIYHDGNMPINPDGFEVMIAHDSFGSPGSTALVFDVNVTRVDSGFDWTIHDIYEYSAYFDPILWDDSSTFWLSIRNRTFDNPDKWFWGGAFIPFGAGNSFFKLNGEPWAPYPQSWEADFELLGTVVPEPATTFILTILGIPLLRRKRNPGSVFEPN